MSRPFVTGVGTEMLALPQASRTEDVHGMEMQLGTLTHAETGLTGTFWTYPEADEIVELGFGRLNNHLRVKIRTWRPSHTHVPSREIEREFDRV